MLGLVAGFIYGLFSLDHFLAGPFLLSRPLVMGGVMGLLFGHVPEGVALGLLGESLWIVVPPAGPFQWDAGLAVALAAEWIFTSPFLTGVDPLPGWAMAVVFLGAIPFAVIGRRLDASLRRGMRPLAERALAGVERGVSAPLRAGLAFGAFVWCLKSMVVFFVAESLGEILCQVVFHWMPAPVAEGLTRAWALWPALGVAAVLHQLSSRFGNARRFWSPGGGA